MSRRIRSILFSNAEEGSLAWKMRRRRFAFFLDLLESVSGPVSILDVGGNQKYWEAMGFVDVPSVQITLLNLRKPVTRYENFIGLAGDGTNLVGFTNDQFDVVFSNSVIEHVGNCSQQRDMAREIQRVGVRYYVQTPNYHFPLEPHYLFPGFHWLPVSLRVFLARNFNLGWRKRRPDLSEARNAVESTRLLTRDELLALFPTAKLWEEKVFGMVKSFIAYGGW